MQLNSPLILFEADYNNYLKGEVGGVIRIPVINTWERDIMQVRLSFFHTSNVGENFLL